MPEIADDMIPIWITDDPYWRDYLERGRQVLGKRYSVDHKSISGIRDGKNWKHVPDDSLAIIAALEEEK